MLEPEIVAFLEQRHGAGLSRIREPLALETLSSSATVERLVLTEAHGERATYVIKRLRPLGDWIARATRDDRMREYQFAASAIPSALPAGTGGAVMHAAMLAGGGAALIMRDVSDHLAPADDERFTLAQTTRAIESLARLHSTFYGFPARLMSGIGLCTLGNWLTLFAPSTGQREAATAATNSVPAMLLPGWDAFARLAPDAWGVLEPLLEDPQPVVAALRACPDTLIHGDVEARHLAFDGDRTILLDWSLCARAPGGIDLGWFLAVNSAKLSVQRDEAIEMYRAERERLRRLPARGEQWERELALSLLTGAMRLGWAMALGAVSEDNAIRRRESAEFAWWADATLNARRWL
jgi:hypothetical protein